MLMLDVDRFKDVNDTHGHEAGDRALKVVARVLSQAVRPNDVCAPATAATSSWCCWPTATCTRPIAAPPS